jgi:hypothetical protein
MAGVSQEEVKEVPEVITERPQIELYITMYSGKKLYDYAGAEMFTIFDLKKYLATLSNCAVFQIRFDIQRTFFSGTNTEDDKKLVKDYSYPSRQMLCVDIKMKWGSKFRISDFVFTSTLEADGARRLVDLGKTEVVYSERSNYSQLVPKPKYENPAYVVFNINRVETAELVLKPSLFKLFKLEKADKKIERKEVLLEVDEKSFAYLINGVASVLCRITEKLKDGVYEVAFGFEEKEVIVKQFPDYKFQKSGYSAWFINTVEYYEDEVSCCICFQQNRGKNHFVCGVCLGIECAKCVRQYHKDHQDVPFTCQSCRNGMGRV